MQIAGTAQIFKFLAEFDKPSGLETQPHALQGVRMEGQFLRIVGNLKICDARRSALRKVNQFA